MSVQMFLDGEWIRTTAEPGELLLPWRLPGKGVFETMRSYDEKIFALDAHLQRMRRGLKTLGIKYDFSDREIEKRLAENFKHNPFRNSRIRLTIWQDKGRTHMAIVSQKHHPLAENVYRRGFRVHAARPRCSSGRRFCDVKSIRYEFYLKAYQEALKRGADEAVIFNKKNEIAEAGRSNIFIVKDGVLFTPALSCGCLNGVTRGIVLKLARKSGIPVKETKLSLKDLRQADEAFLTNSIMEIMPLTFCQGKPVGSGESGPITQRLRRIYEERIAG